jgi:hypothetical protein
VVVKRIFFTDFTPQMQSNEGSFMAISRFILHQWPHLSWFGWWFNGEPFENTYTPMLPLIDALVSFLTGCSPARAFHVVTGLFYALGPVFLFWLAWRISKALVPSFLAALAYSVFSGSAIFYAFRWDQGGAFNLWRLRTLVFYGEGPHNTELAVLPLVLLAAYLAFTTRRYLWFALATLGMAFVLLVNAFSAIDVSIGFACLTLALKPAEMPRAGALAVAIAAGAYVLACPFLPPTLIHTIFVNAQSVGGDFSIAKLATAQLMVLACVAAVWLATWFTDDFFTRFALMFAVAFFAVIFLEVRFNLSALPQPNRYSVEMEMGFALAAVVVFRAAARLAPLPRLVLLVLFLGAVLGQTIHSNSNTRHLIGRINVTKTIEYKVAHWLDQNRPGLRAFVSGDAGTWLNVFSDVPQMNSGHDPFVPNPVIPIATWMIYTGQAAPSILWLKAFGVHSIYVPGPASRMSVKPIQHPEKFMGVAPVLWHEEDDTIFEIPQRTESLAHVIPAAALVPRQPVNGLDIGELERYVSALDDPGIAIAPMLWTGQGKAHIDSELHPGQVISVQVTFDRGWRAFSNGRELRVSRDGLGLMTIEADCQGQCAVDLEFGLDTERRICRVASWTAAILLALAGAFGRTSRLGIA